MSCYKHSNVWYIVTQVFSYQIDDGNRVRAYLCFVGVEENALGEDNS